VACIALVLLYVFFGFKDCREQKSGRGYIGQVNTTVSGKQCQKWSSNTPHVIMSEYSDDKFPDGSREAANNYCRNPDTSWIEGVWCYTMDPDVRWEPCDVPQCGKYTSAAPIFSSV